MKTQELVTSFMKDHTQANFDAMKKNYLALSLVYEELADKSILTDFFFLPTFEKKTGKDLSILGRCEEKETGEHLEWHKLGAYSFGELKTWALEQVAKEYHTFYEWLSYCFYNLFGSQELALQEMKKIHLRFPECEEAFKELDEIKKERSRNSKLSEIKATVEEVAYILLTRMKRQATTFYEWEVIYKNSSNLESADRAFEEMQKLI